MTIALTANVGPAALDTYVMGRDPRHFRSFILQTFLEHVEQISNSRSAQGGTCSEWSLFPSSRILVDVEIA